jgi:7-cyano-7-deazaguanine synthase
MSSASSNEPVGVLLSGGLDSAILLSHLLAQGETVQPFYIRTGVVWEEAERRAVREYLAAVTNLRLLPLVEFELPLADLYERHWSLDGHDVPDADSPDEAVFLPGRNALLLLKPAIWCQRHGIARLALGPLASNPFPDARPAFFASLEETLQLSNPVPVRILRPFGELHKTDVMRLGRDLPLQHTWSCIAPVCSASEQHIHCGKCNKCAERQRAFADVDMQDPTPYSHSITHNS